MTEREAIRVLTAASIMLLEYAGDRLSQAARIAEAIRVTLGPAYHNLPPARRMMLEGFIAKGKS